MRAVDDSRRWRRSGVNSGDFLSGPRDDVSLQRTEAPRWRHGLGFYLLRCDGHTEFVSRAKLFEKSTVASRRRNSDNEPHPELWNDCWPE
jgi:hypothetical protein